MLILVAIPNKPNFHGLFSVILNMILVSYVSVQRNLAKSVSQLLELNLTAHVTSLKDFHFLNTENNHSDFSVRYKITILRVFVRYSFEHAL